MFFYVFYVLSFSFAESLLVWFIKTFGSNAHAPLKTGGSLCRCKPYLNKPKKYVIFVLSFFLCFLLSWSALRLFLVKPFTLFTEQRRCQTSFAKLLPSSLF